LINQSEKIMRKGCVALSGIPMQLCDFSAKPFATKVVAIDKSGANTAALATLNAGKSDDETMTIRQSKYLNNLVEQDHRNIKRRIRQMLGFKSFRRAQTILAGIELIHMIRKGQLQHPASAGLSPAE
jgi:transposase-like protein